MYKFVVIKGGCGSAEYDIGKCEEISNKMAAGGWRLDQVYQTSVSGCCGGKSALVMVFRKG